MRASRGLDPSMQPFISHYMRNGIFSDELFVIDVGLDAVPDWIINRLVDNFNMARKNSLYVAVTVPADQIDKEGWNGLAGAIIASMGISVFQFAGGQRLIGTVAPMEYWCDIPGKGINADALESQLLTECTKKFGQAPQITVRMPGSD